MLITTIRLTLLLLLTLCTAFPVLAWNRTGHLITAAVAYDVLEREHPAVLSQLEKILAAHPAASDWSTWQAEFPDVAPIKLRFMLASVFPDEVRRGPFKAYDRPDWHYINYPISIAKPRVDIRISAPMTGRALDALPAQLAALRDSKLTPSERAVALSWVLHLIGDLAQPLHVGTLVNADFPDGDRGGNDVWVRGSERAQNPVRLHQIWDDAAGGNSLDVQDAISRATLWARTSPMAVRDVPELVQLSYRLADEQAYLSGALPYARAGEANAPVLPEGYTKQLQEVARQQVVIAGRLIADLLGHGRTE